MLRTIAILLRKEVSLELRKLSVLSGIGLYTFSLIFICYIAFNVRRSVMSEPTWAALFWLVALFSVINTVAKSFIGEKKGLAIYYYSVASPEAIVVSKIVYNSILSMVLLLVAYGLFNALILSPVNDHTLFLTTLMLASIGFSSAFTLLSGIAARANNSHVVMAVLSFPIVIGILLMVIRITTNVIDNLDRSASYDELLNLTAINLIITALAYLLFPYIWRS